MRMFKKVLAGLVVAGTVILAFTGCGEEAPTNDSEALLQRAVYNFLETASMRYSAEVLMEFPAGGSSGSADLSVYGAFSNLDLENEGEEFSMVVDVDAPDGQNYKLDVSTKSVGADFYVKLLDFPTALGLSAGSFADFVGPWWQISSESMGGEDMGMHIFGNFGPSEDQLDEIGREARASVLEYAFFDNVEFEGTESLEGRDSYRYSLILDKEGIYKYVEKVNELRGEEMEEESAYNLMGFLVMTDFEGDVWVDKETSTLVKVEGDAKIIDPETSEVVTIELDISFSDLNQPFSIMAPVEYEVFNLELFLGAFLESGMLGGMGAKE